MPDVENPGGQKTARGYWRSIGVLLILPFVLLLMGHESYDEGCDELPTQVELSSVTCTLSDSDLGSYDALEFKVQTGGFRHQVGNTLSSGSARLSFATVHCDAGEPSECLPNQLVRADCSVIVH